MDLKGLRMFENLQFPTSKPGTIVNRTRATTSPQFLAAMTPCHIWRNGFGFGGSNSLRRRRREKGVLNYFIFILAFAQGFTIGLPIYLEQILEFRKVLHVTWGRISWRGVKDPRLAHVQFRGKERICCSFWSMFRWTIGELQTVTQNFLGFMVLL